MANISLQTAGQVVILLLIASEATARRTKKPSSTSPASNKPTNFTHPYPDDVTTPAVSHNPTIDGRIRTASRKRHRTVADSSQEVATVSAASRVSKSPNVGGSAASRERRFFAENCDDSASGECTTNYTEPSAHCPSSECECRTLRDSVEVSMRCFGTAARHLPSFHAVDATFASVSLARLNLSHVPSEAFRAIRVRALDLSGNPLAKNGCVDDAFSGLEDVLQALSLSECGLVRIPAAIARLSQLNALSLDGNRLHSLRRSAFRRNSRLRQLHLQRSGISRLDPGAFDGLPLLRELKLSDNKIATLPPGVFGSLTKLVSLDLASNLIHRLAAETFHSLGALQWLELQSNLLFVIERTMFSGLDGLNNLRLDGNPLLAAEDETFAALPRLKSLSLDVARNTTLTAATLRGLGRLKTLEFGSIACEALPEGLFESMRSLRHLSVQDARGDFSGFTIDLFPPGMNFRELKVIVGAIHHCRCSTDWIRELVDRGASVQGHCGLAQRITCTKPPS